MFSNGGTDMSNCCTMCGSQIPDGQRVCSMCYGDVDYGRDGLYRDYLEQQQREYKEQMWREYKNWQNEDM